MIRLLRPRLAALACALAALTAPAPARAVTVTAVPTGTAQSVLTAAPDASHEVLSAAFQQETDARSRSRLLPLNRFELLENGAAAYPRKLALVQAAQRHILVETMSWEHDTTGKALADALIARAGAGVSVRCVVDGLVADPRIVRRLKEGGVKVTRYNFLGLSRRFDARMHQKLLCVDFDAAVIGGMNVGDDYNLGNGVRGYHDTDLYVEGPLALDAGRRFLDLYCLLEPREASAQVLRAAAHLAVLPSFSPIAPLRTGTGRIIVHDPDAGRRDVTDYYARVIRAAKSQVVWHVKHLVPGEPLLSELKAAAGRGVRVVLVTNSRKAYEARMGAFNAFFTWWYIRTLHDDIFRGVPIEVYEMDTYIHSKAMTVDGVMAAVGSFNFDQWSLGDMELILVTHDPLAVRSVEEMFERDIAKSTRVR
jgi:cardiolipin synthase